MNHILCPIDFSETSLIALEYAVSIAERHKADLSLIYVFTEEYYNEHLTEGVKNYEEYEEEFKSRLSVICDEIKNRDFSTNSHVISGNFLSSVQGFIAAKKIDLIVIGTKGASDVFDMMAGSNAIKLLDNLDIPILAVPKKATFNGLKKIVYATSYQEEDKVAIRDLVHFSMPFKSDITILHLSKRNNLIEDALLSHFKEELESFVNCDSITFEKKTYSENITLGIDDYMMDEKSDVLTILMEKRNIIDRLFHKSVTKELSYLMDFPLLVYKKEKY